MFQRLASLLVTISLVPVVLSATYSVSDTFIGADFLTGFQHQAIADPTHGRVYVAFLLMPGPDADRSEQALRRPRHRIVPQPHLCIG